MNHRSQPSSTLTRRGFIQTSGLAATGALAAISTGLNPVAASASASTHADRIATIRRVWKDYGVMVDPHTADGIKVGLERREMGVPLVCMETAQPAKFAEGWARSASARFR